MAHTAKPTPSELLKEFCHVAHDFPVFMTAPLYRRWRGGTSASPGRALPTSAGSERRGPSPSTLRRTMFGRGSSKSAASGGLARAIVDGDGDIKHSRGGADCSMSMHWRQNRIVEVAQGGHTGVGRSRREVSS
jgi:hypothetical protein